MDNEELCSCPTHFSLIHIYDLSVLRFFMPQSCEILSFLSSLPGLKNHYQIKTNNLIKIHDIHFDRSVTVIPQPGFLLDVNFDMAVAEDSGSWYLPDWKLSRLKGLIYSNHCKKSNGTVSIPPAILTALHWWSFIPVVSKLLWQSGIFGDIQFYRRIWKKSNLYNSGFCPDISSPANDIFWTYFTLKLSTACI